MKVWSLSWGVPGWINSGNGNESHYFGPDQIAYQVKWLECLRDAWGVEPDVAIGGFDIYWKWRALTWRTRR